VRADPLLFVRSVLQPKEVAMAKGQMKGNKEAKKPKGDKPKGPGSAYKQAQEKSGPATNPFSKKT
jgi:hypothetical protein